MRSLSNNLLNQLFAENSETPFLTLLTLSHDSFTTIRLVNNTEDITSLGEVYSAFPFEITLPVDDGESQRQIKLTVDNVTLELIDELRSVSDPIDLQADMILSDDPDKVEISYTDLKLRDIQVDAQRITATILLDDFLNTGMTSEKYTPANFPGLFS